MIFTDEEISESTKHEDPILYLTSLKLGQFWREAQERKMKEEKENRNEKEE